MLVGVIHVGHDEDRLAGLTVVGMGNALQTFPLGLEGLRGPQGDGVAGAFAEGIESFGGLHVLDDDVALAQAEGMQPAAEHVVGRSPLGAEEGLAAYRAGIAVHFGVVGVKAPHLEHGAVGAGINGVGGGFVVADADDVQPIAEGGGQGRHGAHARDGPVRGLHFVDDVLAGFKRHQLKLQPFGLVPSLFSGVPDKKRFVFSKPGRAQRHKRFGERGGTAQAPRHNKK